MEKKRRFRWDRLFECVAFALLTIFTLWVIISYFNIILHNTSENPMYFDWNCFNLTM